MLIILLPLAAFLIAFICDLFLVGHAHKWKLIDEPNHRSSHHIPTPSGGGIGIVLAGSITGLFLAWQFSWVYGAVVLAISCTLAGVGLKDDRQPLPASLRLGIQMVLGGCLLFVLGGMPELQRFVEAWSGRSFIYILLLLVIVWWINLFNFMDGIDGLAGGQAAFMLLAASGLLVWSRPDIIGSPALIWMLCIAAAICGFLILNWAPAKIFMGDVGSVYLAFMVLALGLLTIRNDWIAVAPGLSMWVILGATFVTDATVTLFTRMFTGKRWYEAHRSHAYQRLTRKFGQHKAVTMLYIGINLLWLFPLAAACVFMPLWSGVWVLLAYTPLVIGAIRVGAGRSDIQAAEV